MIQAASIATVDGFESRRVHRDWAERLVDRSAHLPSRDRVLIEQVYGNGVSMTDVARLTGEPARRVQRRVSALVRRVESPLYKFMIVHGESLDQPIRRTAQCVVFEGMSLRAAARVCGVSLHRVRQRIQFVRALARV